MCGVVMYVFCDVCVEECFDFVIEQFIDVVIWVFVVCICGFDFWLYCGIDLIDCLIFMGYEYVGVVEQIGVDVWNVVVGDFVVGLFFVFDNICEICCVGYQLYCVYCVLMGVFGMQVELLCVLLVDGMFVVVFGDLMLVQLCGLLVVFDVLGIGWFVVVVVVVGLGRIVVVVGDGVVGLFGVFVVKQFGVECIIVMFCYVD